MRKHLKKLKQEIFTAGRSVALISTILLASSAFLTWGKTPNVEVNGLNGDGIITISIGILAFILLFIKHVKIWIALLFGLVGLTIGLIDFYAMAKTVEELNGSIGIGLYTTIIASLGIVIGTIIEIIEEKKKKLNLFYLDEDPLAQK